VKGTRRFPGEKQRGCGTKIVHHYFDVDYEAVFLALHDDLPVLKREVQSILNEAKR